MLNTRAYISILVIGSSYDLGAENLILSALKKFVKLDIPTIFCTANVAHEPLNLTVKKTLLDWVNCENFFKVFSEFDKYITMSHILHLSYLKEKNKKKLEKELLKTFSEDDSIYKNFLESLSTPYGYKFLVSKKFAYVEDKKIPYRNINLPDKNINFLYEPISYSTSIVERFYKEALLQIKEENTVIICEVPLHMTYLFSHKLQFKLKDVANLNYSFQVNSFIGYSGYENQYAINEAVSLNEKSKTYWDRENPNKIPFECPIIKLEETKKGFRSREFDFLYSKIIKFLSPANLYTIGDINNKKIDLIKELKGKIIFHNSTLNESNVFIKENPSIDNLGELDLFSLAIKNTPEELRLIKRVLENIGGITIKSTETAEKIIVIFSHDKYEIIDEIIHDWKKVKNENYPIISKPLCNAL